MGEPAEQAEVVDFADYLRQTIAEIDEVVTSWAARRTQLAVRLAAIEAAEDPEVAAAAADYEARMVEGRAYEDAEDAERVLSEAGRRYCP